MKFTIKNYVLNECAPGIWRIDPSGKMRVGVHLVGHQRLLEKLKDERSIDQAINVASLKGVLDPVLTMPDIHQGYGFPIGGVAAFHAKNGIISPGGVGYDINCGVRILLSPLTKDEIHTPPIMKALIEDLFQNVPAGVGSIRHDLSISQGELKDILMQGAHWAVGNGMGTEEDLAHTEERGQLMGADPEALSSRALERGIHQLGTLGSGNHFVEIGYVDEIRAPEIASVFGLKLGQITVSIHTGSRGLGYQVCTDYLEESLNACQKYKLELPDPELAYAPLDSPEGKNYLKAMSAASNFAFCNRQVITHWVREVFSKHFKNTKLELLYDVCHNIAKFETIGEGRTPLEVCIHRKGATRAYPPHHSQIPIDYREVGQPILIPGDMGRYSFILAGQKGAIKHTWGSACHGAGREMSRSKAKKIGGKRPIIRELERLGIFVKTSGRETAIEEMPEAYKDVSEVVEATEQAGLAKVVARLRPIGVIKG